MPHHTLSQFHSKQSPGYPPGKPGAAILRRRSKKARPSKPRIILDYRPLKHNDQLPLPGLDQQFNIVPQYVSTLKVGTRHTISDL